MAAILERIPLADLKTLLKIMKKISALIENEKKGAGK